MDAKRLFCVRSGNGSIVTFENGVQFFTEKMIAKAHRDWCKDNDKNGEYRVSIGPDHRRNIYA